MQPAPRSRSTPYRFENLSFLTRQEAVLWNWYIHTVVGGTDWRAWLSEMFSHLVERPAGQQLQLTQTHLVDADFGEKLLSFGSKQEIFIGRAAENEVVLPAKAVANQHAHLFWTDGQLQLKDLGGRLGIYLWDKRISANETELLRNGDQFSIFPYRFRVILQQSWVAETDVVLGECRAQPLTRAEFLAMSPAGRRIFVVNPHPGGQRALLEVSPSFLVQLQQRILAPLGLDGSGEMLPSDDAFAGFVMLAILERVNRGLKFPVQFSFGRGKAHKLVDSTRGISLSSAVQLGDLTGHFRVFLPLEFLSQYKSATDEAPQGSLPAGLFWKFPISIGFVDLTPNEMWQIGVGDILVTEDSAAALFPNHFGKGWILTRDASNSRRFTVDKYFERSMSLEPTGETTISGSKPDIGSLPLRLHVIVGEREFTLAEVKTLAPGTIVELEATKSDPVHLMVNGKIIGDGELVDVEGKLAVKVLGWRST